MMLSGYYLESRCMDIDRIVVGPLAANCYIIKLEKLVLVIDPGAEAEKIIDFMDSKRLKPDLIINTHGHFDHIEAVPGLQEKYGIDFYIDPGDEGIITDPVKNGSSIFGQNNLSLKTYNLIDNAAKKFFAANGIEIINTPGHSPGSIVISIGNNLFTGDLLFRGSIGRTDLAGGNIHDMKSSLLKVKEMEGYLKIYPGHGLETDLEYEKNNNYYLGDNVLF
jgi:glyoxylase-like metal-dependent hydrolase (beta-lactamase superfamily II)